jgi:DNA-binding NarL/FixJ family response regulator
MYADVIRPLGTDRILATALVVADPYPGADIGNLHVCVSLQRSGRDFTPAGVRLLARLRPLLARRVRQLDIDRLVPSTRLADPAGLTCRQREILSLVGTGMTDLAIGRRLGCSPRTIDKHLEHIYRRLGVTNRTAATAVWLADLRRPHDPVGVSGG